MIKQKKKLKLSKVNNNFLKKEYISLIWFFLIYGNYSGKAEANKLWTLL